jgi:hypothetical protein
MSYIISGDKSVEEGLNDAQKQIEIMIKISNER